MNNFSFELDKNTTYLEKSVSDGKPSFLVFQELVYDKEDMINQWRRDGFFNKIINFGK